MSVEPQRPQFRQVADLIRTAIESGEYPAGSTLPGSADLARRYQVSETTVNQAVRILRTEGMVRVERGRGTIVREIPVIHRAAATRYSKQSRESGGGRGAFDTEIKRLGLAPRSDVEIERAVPPAEVAEQLGVDAAGESVIVRRRKMYADDVPVQLAPSYIPADIAEGTALAEADSGPGGIISRFADLGYRQTRVTESVRVRRATDEERAFLNIEEDQPVVEIFHTGWAGDRAVEVCVHSVPASLWRLDYEWPLS